MTFMGHEKVSKYFLLSLHVLGIPKLHFQAYCHCRIFSFFRKTCSCRNVASLFHLAIQMYEHKIRGVVVELNQHLCLKGSDTRCYMRCCVKRHTSLASTGMLSKNSSEQHYAIIAALLQDFSQCEKGLCVNAEGVPRVSQGSFFQEQMSSPVRRMAWSWCRPSLPPRVDCQWQKLFSVWSAWWLITKPSCEIKQIKRDRKRDNVVFIVGSCELKVVLNSTSKMSLKLNDVTFPGPSAWTNNH